MRAAGKFAFLLLALMILQAAGAGRAFAEETVTNTIGGGHQIYPQPRLDCPGNTYLVGLRVRQGGWLARVDLRCAGATLNGTRAGEIIPGPGAGGNGGTHDSNVDCPAPAFVHGINGLDVVLERYAGFWHSEYYAADPRLECITGDGVNLGEVSDPAFERTDDGTVDYKNVSDIFGPQRFPSEFNCPQGAVAKGVWYVTGDDEDFVQLGLICTPLRKVSTNLITSVVNPALIDDGSGGTPPAPTPTPMPSTTQTFAPPTGAGGRVIAFCVHYFQPNTCGQPAADQFCQQQGFVSAQSFTEGPKKKTVTVLGSVCSDNQCRSFAQIVCTK